MRNRLWRVAAGLVIVVGVGSFALVAAAREDGAGLAIETWAVGSDGTPVEVEGQAAELLGRFGGPGLGALRGVSLMKSVGTNGVFRIATTSGKSCAAVGQFEAGRVTQLGIVQCPIDPSFPSAERPALDLSVITIAKGAPRGITRVQGLAADGVVAIGLIDATGAIAAEVPTAGNAYLLEDMPPGIAGLVALDKAGTAVPIQGS